VIFPNSVKITVGRKPLRNIGVFEKQLPVSLYAYEWKLLEQGKGKIYKPVAHIEQWIPIVFILLNIGLGAYSVLT